MTEEERNLLECVSLEDLYLFDEVRSHSRYIQLGCSSKSITHKAKMRETSVQPIVYFSTSEGLVSHMHQFDVAWQWGRAFNRSVIAYDFQSAHYGWDYFVSVCDIFIFPNTFSCLRHATRPLTENSSCYVVGIGSWSTNRSMYYLNESTSVCADLNLRTVQCFGAYIGPRRHMKNSDHKVIYPKLTEDSLFQHASFTRQYMSLFLKMNRHLKIKYQNTAVFHWRRGDQKEDRCGVKFDGSVNFDDSVNCWSVSEFIKLVETVSLEQNLQKSTKYIATNEEDPVILEILANRSYILLSNNLKFVELEGLNALERFMIDLMMACYAKVFFAWGYSNMHWFIDMYRKKISRKSGRIMLTSINSSLAWTELNKRIR